MGSERSKGEFVWRGADVGGWFVISGVASGEGVADVVMAGGGEERAALIHVWEESVPVRGTARGSPQRQDPPWRVGGQQ